MQGTRKSEADREQNLWIASRKYVSGEIDISQLEEIEHDYTQDFNEAMIAVSKRNVSHNVLKRILGICGLEC